MGFNDLTVWLPPKEKPQPVDKLVDNDHFDDLAPAVSARPGRGQNANFDLAPNRPSLEGEVGERGIEEK